MILFRIYQYACYSFVFMILSPVILLYMFDITLYLFRLMIYFMRFQVYLIKNRCIPETRIVHRTGGSFAWKMKMREKETEPEEECDSSNTSILSAFRDSKESLLDDSASISSNYSLVGSQATPRAFHSSRNNSIITLDSAQMSILAAHAEICKLRRGKKSDVEVSLDRYENRCVPTKAI